MTIGDGTGIKLIQSRDGTMALRTHTTHKYYYRMTDDIKIDFDHDLENCPFILRDYSDQFYLCTIKHRYKLVSHSSFHYGDHVYVNENGEILTLDSVNKQLVVLLPSKRYSTFRLIKNVTDRNTGTFVVSDDHIFIAGNSKVYAYTWGYWKDFEVSVDTPLFLYFDGERNYLLSLGMHSFSIIDVNEESVLDTVQVEDWVDFLAVIDRFKRYWIIHHSSNPSDPYVCLDIYEPQNGKLTWTGRKNFTPSEFANMCVDAKFNIVISSYHYGIDTPYVWMATSNYTHASDIALHIRNSDPVYGTLFSLGNYPAFVIGSTGYITGYEPYVSIYDIYTQDYYYFKQENKVLFGDPGLSKCYTWGGPIPNKNALLSAMEVIY